MMVRRVQLSLRHRGDGGIDVIALGENSLDFVAVRDVPKAFPAGDVTPASGKHALAAFHLQPGGQMATAALGCARLGLRVRYVGAFGTDEWSVRSRAPLEAAGVDVVGVVRHGVPGRVAVILVDEAGERTVLEHRHPSLLITPGDITREMIAAARMLLVDATHPDAALQAVRWARETRTLSIVDVDRPSAVAERLLDEVDVAIVPEPFVAAWIGEASHDGLRRLVRRCSHAALVVVTRGSQGSLAHCAGRIVATPACRVDVVDTTGAGDAFRAGVAAALLHLGPDAPIDDVLTFANATAGLNCRAIGAQDGLPTLDEVLTCVRR